jgi:chemotaxis response regulator CheB
VSGARHNECKSSDLIRRLRSARRDAVRIREECAAIRSRLAQLQLPGGGPAPKFPPQKVDSRFFTRPLATQLVTIGGSAGSSQIAAAILAGLPPTCDAAIGVALHGGAAHLVTALSTICTLPVKWACSLDVLRSGCVYVAPANHHLVVNADTLLTVTSTPRAKLFCPSIDWLFQSAAVTFNERHTSVVLSGRLNDGADGTRVVMRCGGTTYAQDPDSCEFGEMPLAAIQTGCVREVLAIGDLASAVARKAEENLALDATAWLEPFAS